MPVIAKAAFVACLAQSLIMLGVGFISGQIFPQSLAHIYTSTSPLARTMIAALTLFTVANFVLAHGYAHYNAAYVAPFYIVFAVLVNVAFAWFVLGSRLSWQLALATLVLMAASAWVSLLLQKTA